MKRILLSVFLIAVFAAYVAFHHESATTVYALPSLAGEKKIVPDGDSNGVRLDAVPGRPDAIPPRSFADGEYTGDAGVVYYGNVRVKALIQDGVLVALQFLEYPHHHPTSMVINTRAMPLLQAETIRTQDADVDIVSGATFTSLAFSDSLTSALSKAAKPR